MGDSTNVIWNIWSIKNTTESSNKIGIIVTKFIRVTAGENVTLAIFLGSVVAFIDVDS